MNKNEIKKIILDELGNPVSGRYAQTAEAIAEAIYQASQGKPETKTESKSEKKSEPAKETRVVSPDETR